MNIYKNFLKKEHSNKIYYQLQKPYFPWFYSKHQNNKDTSYMFHLFYDGAKVNSDYFYLVEPILEKLKIKNLLHVDKLTKNLKHKTSIYYVNTNNGYTLFKNKKVKCEKNKIVIFNADQKHKAKIQTDKDIRIVININYEYN